MVSGTVIPAGRTVPLLLALPPLALSAVLPWRIGWVLAIVVIIALGVPHGALDVEIGRTLLRKRAGVWWFPLFAGPYLFLMCVVLLAWRLMPEAVLAMFLAASVWHFGTEETGGGWLALFHGGLPIALPVLLHPVATAGVLSAITCLTFDQPPIWLTIGAALWLPLALLTIFFGKSGSLPLLGVVGSLFALLPPLTAFAAYFVVMHAPSHMAAMIRHPSRAPRVRTYASAWRLAAPTTVLTIAIGAALWPSYTGEGSVRLVRITLQMLAALTLPHMMFESWLAHVEAKNATI